ncbi:MAG: aminodeoxychorismate lyase [Porticoccaceae bacterium]|nr:aminodeoxychorismate lyase [Porticoccaceae bacterium]MDG1311693.1 aminodeoxychorismate lyase [Porticoccaceae bacterium]
MFYYSINGEFGAASSEAIEWSQDRGLAYGHGLFETMLYQSNKLPLQERHVQRLCLDAAVLGITLDVSVINRYLNKFQRALQAAQIEAGVIKLLATAGAGGRGYQSPDSISPRVICQYSEFDADQASQQRAQGIGLWRCDYRLPANPVLAGIKHLNRLDQIMARNEWDSADYADGLMLADDGTVVEATSANIFAKTSQGWVTPPLDRAGVSGVMRALLIDEIFPAAGIALNIKPLALGQLAAAEELFICNSIRGIIPVSHIAGSDCAPAIKLVISDQTKMLQSTLAQQYSCYL